MIVEFRFKNYRSFADESFVQFDAVPAFKENLDNLIQTKDVSILKSLAIYGANASGKTNVIVALRWLRNQVLRSAKQNSTDRINVHPFALDRGLATAPTLMEIRVLIDGIYYRYGFEATSESIVSEWLMWSKRLNGRDWALFTRDGAGISYGNSYKGEKLYEKDILKNTLLLSRLDQTNVEVAAKLMCWFKNLRIVFGTNGGRRYNSASIDMLDADESREAVIAFTQLADGTIDNIVHHDVEDLPTDYAEFLKKNDMPIPQNVGFVRRANVESGRVELLMNQDESAGTGKMFDLAGVWMGVLKQGGVLAVDELEAQLHPLLTRILVKMFNSKEANPFGAQLLFVTHDSNLLEYGGLRRDQIWFCEKNKCGRSSLYSLAEIKETKLKRKDTSIGRNYIEGKYGAVPFFGGWERLLRLIASTASSNDEKGACDGAD